MHKFYTNVIQTFISCELQEYIEESVGPSGDYNIHAVKITISYTYIYRNIILFDKRLPTFKVLAASQKSGIDV